jgi:hypothetical protein
LRNRLEGELRFDAGARALYATDLSIYRQPPIGVVVPRSIDDVLITVEECRRRGVPILGRGCGTSLAGQCCNIAVVIALSENDPAALLALYAKDATVESPLVPYLMGTEKGICRGHEELRPLFEKVAKRKPKVRQYFRTGYLTDGKKLMWEYPQSGPEGEQMDFVEVMELNDEGLIQKHRVYWGWFGVGVLQKDEYYR